MTVSELRTHIQRQLAACGNSEQESAWIVSRATAVPVPEFPFETRALSYDEIVSAKRMSARRLNGEPLQYILGDEYFGELLLKVGPGCLIPRPETWGIVEVSASVLPRNGMFCELGVGSGAISLAVAQKRPDAHIFGSDVSLDALYWANRNLNAYEFSNVEFRNGSLFDPFPGMLFDVIAANLPYIPYEARENLQKEVRDFEPEIALFAADAGTALMKEAIRELRNRWTASGAAFFEMSPEQLPVLADYASSCSIPVIRILPDCFGRARFLELHASE